jgi:hypothetical protein
MASRGPKSIGGLLLGSKTLKVLMHSPIPVLVSSVMHNSTTPERDKAIGVILDEHRSTASVFHALRLPLVWPVEKFLQQRLTLTRPRNGSI